MLRNVPQILSPELLKVISEMGHSDRIVLTDANFPAESMGRNCKVIRCDGLKVPQVLDAILKVMRLDEAIDKPATLMEVAEGDDCDTPIWDVYKEIVSNYDKRGAEAFQEMERFTFYEAAKTAYAIVYCSEYKLYANLMLQKGVLKPEDYILVYGEQEN